MRVGNTIRRKWARHVLPAMALGGALLVGGGVGAAGRGHAKRDKATVTEFHGAAAIALDNIGFGPKRLCIPIGLVLASGDFFDGLQRIRGPLEFEFQYRKAAAVVREFPESLLIQVRVAPSVCGLGEMGVGRNAPLLWDEQFMRSWRFQLNWVSGARVRPVDVVSSEGWIPVQVMVGPQQWKYNFWVRSANVPITESLRLELLSPEGQHLAQLVGGMDRADPAYEPPENLRTDIEPRPYRH